MHTFGILHHHRLERIRSGHCPLEQWYYRWASTGWVQCRMFHILSLSGNCSKRSTWYYVRAVAAVCFLRRRRPLSIHNLVKSVRRDPADVALYVDHIRHARKTTHFLTIHRRTWWQVDIAGRCATRHELEHEYNRNSLYEGWLGWSITNEHHWRSKKNQEVAEEGYGNGE